MRYKNRTGRISIADRQKALIEKTSGTNASRLILRLIATLVPWHLSSNSRNSRRYDSRTTDKFILPEDKCDAIL